MKNSFIQCDGVSVQFPIYGANAKSFKARLLGRVVGGRFSQNTSVVTVTALNDVSFRAETGDRIGLYGHNGSGKTTLLKTLAGGYFPSTGKITYAGDITSLIDIGLGIDPESTGMENIYLRSLLLGKSKREIARARDEIAEFSGLGDFLRLPVKVYSSGMALRLTFSICTAYHPDILLLDEWLSVGDENFAQKSEERMKRITETANIIIIASHNLALLERLCNKIFVLEKGSLSLFQRPPADEMVTAPVVPAIGPSELSH